ncbi:MAG: type II 3-dehydroquinate dehydratase [Bacteroidota bacterium]
MKILIINGPNLNMLGQREPEIYGSETFDDILAQLREEFPVMQIDYFQSNHEGAIVDRIQTTLTEDLQGLVVNMGAYTHYSYAIYDALNMLSIPKVEVHLSHLFSRETFRHTSVMAPTCDGLISGFGKHGYRMALMWMGSEEGVKTKR